MSTEFLPPPFKLFVLYQPVASATILSIVDLFVLVFDLQYWKDKTMNEKRIERIENELKRARMMNRSLFALVIGTLALIGLGAATEPEKPAEVRAKKIILEDGGGKERGVLAVSDKSVELKLLGADGKSRAVLYADDTGEGLCLSGADGKERIRMRTRGNMAHLVFSDASEKQRVQLEMSDDQPGLILSDANGKEQVRLKIEGDSPLLSLADANGKQRIRVGMRGGFPNFTLSGSAGEPFWSAIPDRY
jgi:hypothetical protein